MAEEKSGWARTTFLIVGNLLSLACLFWTLREANLSELWQDLLHMDWSWLAVAAIADISVYFWHGLRWSLLLRPVVGIDAWHTIRAIYVGLFANEVFPFRIGELLRCYLLTRWTRLPFSVSVASALIERVFDGIWMYGCLLVVLRLVTIPHDLRYLDDAAYALGVVVLLGTLVLAFALFQRHAARRFLVGARWKRRIAILLDDLALIGHSRYLFLAFLQSLPYLLLQVIPIWATAKAFGLELPLTGALVVMVFVRLGTSVPSAPGNLGLFQFLTKECLQHFFQVPSDEAARFSLVLWGVVTIPLLTAGFVALTVTGAKIGELKRAASEHAQALEERV